MTMGWRDRINTDVRAVWRQASTWVLAFLVPFPELYNIAAGWIGYADLPSAAKHVMYGFAAVGLAAKHYRQNAPKPKDGAP